MSSLSLLILLVASSVVFSSAGVATKFALPYITPMFLAFLRFAIAAAVVTPFALASHRFTKKEILLIAPIALFSAANVGLFYFGLTYTTANASAIIYTIVPLVTLLIAQKILSEMFSITKILGIIIGFIGALIIVVLPALQQNGAYVGDIRGNIFILIAAVSWAIYTVGSRKLATQYHYSPIVITTVTLWVSAVLFGVISLVLGQADVSKINTPQAIGVILYVGLVIGATAYLLYQWVIQKTSASTATLTMYIQPVAGVILNGIFLGETISSYFVLGSVLVFAGVFLATEKQFVNKFFPSGKR